MMETVTGLQVNEAEKQLKDLGLRVVCSGEGETVSGQIPVAGTQIPAGSEVILYCGEEVPVRMVTVPDFVGLTRQQASDTAGQLGLYLASKGNTGLESTVIVTAQSLDKNTLAPAGTTITLEFTDTQVRD